MRQYLYRKRTSLPYTRKNDSPTKRREKNRQNLPEIKLKDKDPCSHTHGASLF